MPGLFAIRIWPFGDGDAVRWGACLLWHRIDETRIEAATVINAAEKRIESGDHIRGEVR